MQTLSESQKDRVTISFLNFFLTTLQHESEKAGGDTADAIQSLFSLQAQNGKNCLSLDIHLSHSNSILPLETEIQKEISYSDPEDGSRKDALLQAPACLIVNVNREQEGDSTCFFFLYFVCLNSSPQCNPTQLNPTQLNETLVAQFL